MLIAALLFCIANTLFKTPTVLFGTAQPTIALLCIIAGIVLLIPAFAAIVIALVNGIGNRKSKKQTEQAP